jgi:hypothetical protein
MSVLRAPWLTLRRVNRSMFDANGFCQFRFFAALVEISPSSARQLSDHADPARRRSEVHGIPNHDILSLARDTFAYFRHPVSKIPSCLATLHA